MTTTRMTSKDARAVYTHEQIKAMIDRAKKMPIDKREINTDQDIAAERVIYLGRGLSPQEQVKAAAAVLKLKRGRPPKLNPKKRVDMRFDQDVLAGLKSYFGRGWSTKVNDTMRRTLARAGVL